MRVSAKADYAVRAMVELAATGSRGAPAKGEALAAAQEIPLRFLENILGELRVPGWCRASAAPRAATGCARRPTNHLAEIIRAVEGPLATVRGESAEEIEYRGARRRCSRSGSRCGQHPPGARDR